MILKVENLNKSFKHPWTLKKIQVLKNVCFQVEKKSMVGFLGANGAGKTTSIKCLLGLLTYDSGNIHYFGSSRLDRGIKEKIGYLPERPFFYNYLTAEEFLEFYGQLSGTLSPNELKQRINQLLDLVGLEHARKKYLKQFSKGMLQRVGMAQALIHRPKLLILDEPLSGLDPDGRRQLVHIIRSTFEEEETTIFFSSHLLDDIDRMCQDLVLIRQGEVKFNGPKGEFVRQGVGNYQIRFKGNEAALSMEKVESIESLQQKIDSLREQGKQILAVEEEKVSLDKAFARFNEWENRQ